MNSHCAEEAELYADLSLEAERDVVNITLISVKWPSRRGNNFRFATPEDYVWLTENRLALLQATDPKFEEFFNGVPVISHDGHVHVELPYDAEQRVSGRAVLEKLERALQRPSTARHAEGSEASSQKVKDADLLNFRVIVRWGR